MTHESPPSHRRPRGRAYLTRRLLAPLKRRSLLGLEISPTTIAVLTLGAGLVRMCPTFRILGNHLDSNALQFLDGDSIAILIHLCAMPYVVTAGEWQVEGWGHYVFDKWDIPLGAWWLIVSSLALLFALLARPRTLPGWPVPSWTERWMWFLGTLLLAALVLYQSLGAAMADVLPVPQNRGLHIKYRKWQREQRQQGAIHPLSARPRDHAASTLSATCPVSREPSISIHRQGNLRNQVDWLLARRRVPTTRLSSASASVALPSKYGKNSLYATA